MDIKQKIEQANQIAFKKMTDADPVLVDIAPAIEVIPGLEDKMVLHSGPPIAWEKMCGAQRGAIIGEVLYEGWAKNVEEAVRLLETGQIKLEPNHHHQIGWPDGRHDFCQFLGIRR